VKGPFSELIPAVGHDRLRQESTHTMRNDHSVLQRWKLSVRVEKGVQFLQLFAEEKEYRKRPCRRASSPRRMKQV
jgi:hypothetical protein